MFPASVCTVFIIATLLGEMVPTLFLTLQTLAEWL